MTVALNLILMALVFSAVVGTLAWTILSARPARPSPGLCARRRASPLSSCGPATRRSADALWRSLDSASDVRSRTSCARVRLSIGATVL